MWSEKKCVTIATASHYGKKNLNHFSEVNVICTQNIINTWQDWERLYKAIHQHDGKFQAKDTIGILTRYH